MWVILAQKSRVFPQIFDFSFSRIYGNCLRSRTFYHRKACAWYFEHHVSAWFYHHQQQVPDMEQTLAAMPLQTSLYQNKGKLFHVSSEMRLTKSIKANALPYYFSTIKHDSTVSHRWRAIFYDACIQASQARRQKIVLVYALCVGTHV